MLVTDYELQYSESYTGTIHQEATIEGCQYCTSLDRAFQSLMSENFNNFVLTIGCSAVAIYCKGNVGIESPWISTFGICRNLLLYGNILFWLLSSTITTFITLQRTKINTSRLIHDRQWRNCVTTVTVAIWQSPKYNSRCAILKARVHAAMRLVWV